MKSKSPQQHLPQAKQPHQKQTLLAKLHQNKQQVLKSPLIKREPTHHKNYQTLSLNQNQTNLTQNSKTH